MSNDTLLAIPFFTFMGLILERSGMAEDLLDTIGPVVRHGARRPRLCGDFRRRPAGGDDRRGRRLGHLDGADLAADHAALRLRPPRRDRRDRRLRHARADHSAVARAHRDGRPARPFGRRHVRGRLHPRTRAGRPVCDLYLHRHDGRADRRPRPAARGRRISRRKRQPGTDLARTAGGRERRVRLVRHADLGIARRRLRGALHVLGHPVRLRHRCGELGPAPGSPASGSCQTLHSRRRSSWCRRCS